ncbi:DUF5018 domain-containing protein [Bacteroides thetaiotaomicron]|nr:DUF5018 domain-containing protein [Bacteroides thetaiotaomicron]MCS2207913.1 DUF5018 domain-containing protein [Bacteroides thetaiotaomicron]
MKKNIQYLLLGVLALMSSCQDPEYVLQLLSGRESQA